MIEFDDLKSEEDAFELDDVLDNAFFSSRNISAEDDFDSSVRAEDEYYRRISDL